MARFLLVWELGDGLGHVHRLRTIAQALRARGHEPLLVVQSLRNASLALGDLGFTVLPAPHEPPRLRDQARPLTSMSDILGAAGWDDEPLLTVLARAWRGLYDALRPDIVVADYAPTAALVARGRLPVLVVGNGFSILPDHLLRCPRFRDGAPRCDEDEVLARAIRVASAVGATPPASLPALFGPEAWVVSIPELDPWAAERRAPALGPLLPPSGPLSAAPVRDVFAYVSMTWPHTPALLDGLARSGVSLAAYLRDASPEDRALWRSRGLDVRDRPRGLAEEAAEARLIAHHGGIGTVEQVLGFGRPQALFPRHVEQLLNGRAVQRLGVGGGVRAGDKLDPAAVGEAIRQLLGRPDITARARAVAAAQTGGVIDRLVARCEALAG